MRENQLYRLYGRQIVSYLKEKGWNTKRDIARELGIDPISFEIALQTEDCKDIKQGIRPDSYGKEVIWV